MNVTILYNTLQIIYIIYVLNIALLVGNNMDDNDIHWW